MSTEFICQDLSDFISKSFSDIYIKYMIIILKRPGTHIFHLVKQFHLFLSNTNTLLNVKTILFETIH